ncbi:MFS transporter [Arthrobacter sp. zg-Y411]|uniref:MFS transporter n=1 Tax=Arthrobacter zhangbolii TaxID=2886936 RepID=UPI001D1484ED|nr:MFS transporter [Arthrobacter zhangbolii]MCC3296156.1 MFS transporter [Arthrobacter zhangbolii]
MSTPWASQRLAASLFLMLGTDMFIVSPLLPRISETFGVTNGEAAVVAWSFSLVYAVLSPAFALVSNRYTRRSAMVFGAVVFSAGALAVSLLPTLELVVAGRVLTAVGAAIMGPPIWSYVSETAAPHETGKAVARVASTFAAGQILGVPLGGFVAQFASWRWVFLGIAVLTAGLAVLIGSRLTPEDRVPERARLSSALRDSLGLWRQPTMTYLVVANFFAQATRYATYTFAGALLFMRFGLETAQLGLVGAAVGAGSLLGSMLGGHLVDRVHAGQGSQTFLNCVYAAIMTCSVVLATAAGNEWLALAGWVVTFAAGSAFVSNGQELLTRSAGKDRAYALSWNNAALYAGTAAGSFTLALLPLGGPLFIMTAGALGALTLVASALLWWRAGGEADPMARSTKTNS